MKKLFICILWAVYFYATVCFAISPVLMNIATDGGGGAGGGCDSCTGATYFSWHMENVDVTTGTPCGCAANDETGTATGSPAINAGQASDGTNAVHINAADEFYTFDEPVDHDNIKLTFHIYVVSFPVTGSADCEIFRSEVDADNALSIRIVEGGSMVAYNKVGGTTEQLTCNMSSGAWKSCEYQAKTGVAGNDHYLKVAAVTDEDDDDIGSAAASTSHQWGDDNGDEAAEYYLDVGTISTCDRY